MWPHARYCSDCRDWLAAESNREYQRKRRARAKKQRHLDAGFLTSSGTHCFPRCAHCGEGFFPKRTTARYCSTRCRVAAHRSKHAEAPPQSKTRKGEK
jgi:hypothetical protein